MTQPSVEMSDHTINLALLIIAVATGLFEAGIFWMILQDYRKVRGMPELSYKRLLILGFLSLGPLVALFVLWMFATNLRPKPEHLQVEPSSWWLYGLLLLIGASIGLTIGRLIRVRATSAIGSTRSTEAPSPSW